MDADAQARIFERVQIEYPIDEITVENVNEIMNNRAHSRTDKWKEDGRTRTRDVQVRFSAKKDAIARDMAQISKIYNDAGQPDKAEQVSREYDDFQYELTQANIDKMEARLTESVREVIDRFVDRQDFSGLKSKQFSLENKDILVDSKNIQDNQLYNLAGSIMRDARDSKDIGRLERLRDEVRGTAAAEWSGQIDREIDKIKNQ